MLLKLLSPEMSNVGNASGIPCVDTQTASKLLNVIIHLNSNPSYMLTKSNNGGKLTFHARHLWMTLTKAAKGAKEVITMKPVLPVLRLHAPYELDEASPMKCLLGV